MTAYSLQFTLNCRCKLCGLVSLTLSCQEKDLRNKNIFFFNGVKGGDDRKDDSCMLQKLEANQTFRFNNACEREASWISLCGILLKKYIFGKLLFLP